MTKNNPIFKTCWTNSNPINNENGVTHLLASSLNEKSVFLSASEDCHLRLFDTATGKMICQSDQLKHSIRNIVIANLESKNVVLASLENDTIEIYDLQTLSRYDTTITIDGGAYYGMCIAEFEGKTQVIVNITSDHIDTWDLKTGTPIHKSLEMIREDGRILKDLEISIQLIYLNDNPVLAVIICGCNEVFLYDLVKGHNLGELEFDELMMNNVDECTGDYEIIEIRTIHVNNKTTLVTGSANGRIACFDSENFERIGKILNTELDEADFFEGFEVLNVNGKNIAVAIVYDELKIYDLDIYKKLKTIKFDQMISALTVSEDKIIVACGEEIIAIEVK